jgi:hypothetical protein
MFFMLNIAIASPGSEKKREKKNTLKKKSRGLFLIMLQNKHKNAPTLYWSSL